MYLLNMIYAALTGWSIGYCGVYCPKHEEQKYVFLLAYMTIIYCGFLGGLDILPNLLGFACCLVTVLAVAIPRFPDGTHYLK